MNFRFTFAAIAAAISIAGCTSTPTFQEGPDAEVTFDGLTRLDGTVMDVAWVRRDIDLSSFSKVMFQGVGFEYRPVDGPVGGREGMSTMSIRRNSSTEFAIGPNTRELFEKEITESFMKAVSASERYQVVNEAGPDVLLVRGGLLDVVSRVPPEAVGRSTVFIDSVGEATLVLEVRDSVSNAIFARAVDRRAARRGDVMMESNRVTNQAEVRRLGRDWGDQLRRGLEALLATP
jgi:hypothetical protein